MTLDDIKADIQRRGWRLDYCGATWPGSNTQGVLLLAGAAQYLSGQCSTEFSAVQSAYEKALEGEGVKVDEWTRLTHAMADEGFAYELHSGSLASFPFENEAWVKREGTSGGLITNRIAHPVLALADLLEKCRAEWPKPHSFDSLLLNELLDICDERGWKWKLGVKNRKGVRQFYGYIAGETSADWSPSSHADGLRDQMKRKEAGG